jgi:hypothetical protein
MIKALGVGAIVVDNNILDLTELIYQRMCNSDLLFEMLIDKPLRDGLGDFFVFIKERTPFEFYFIDSSVVLKPIVVANHFDEFHIHRGHRHYPFR